MNIFVPVSAPLLQSRIFATLMTSQSDVRVRMRSLRKQKSGFSELVFPCSAFTAFQWTRKSIRIQVNK